MNRNWSMKRLRGLADRFGAMFKKLPARRAGKRRTSGAGGAPNLREGGPRAAVLRLRAMGEGGALREELAQGTTEYAILVGVLVVIAILAIIAFRDKVSELWEAISSGINSL